MNDQLSQAYDIDNRRAGTYTERAGQPISATDNEAAKNFLASFTARKRAQQKPNLSSERAQEDRFIVNVGGAFPSATIGFRNSFRARW